MNLYKIWKISESLILFLLFRLKVSDAVDVLRPRGVSLEDAAKYVASENFTCFDGSKSMIFAKINDDYCDCEDGSDEPGTSACVNAEFHCNNKGYVEQKIKSSYVNDGVCDCCDGSDEYSLGTDCFNNCNALGEAALREAELAAEIHREGCKLQQAMAEQGSQMKISKLSRIEILNKEKIEVELQHKEKAAVKETAESQESVALEKYKAIKEEMEANRLKEEKQADEQKARIAFEELDVDNDGFLSVTDFQENNIFDSNKDGKVSEDEVSFYFQDAEKLDINKFIDGTWELVKPVYFNKGPMFEPPTEESETEQYEKDPDPLKPVDKDYETNDMDDEDYEDIDNEQEGESSPDVDDEPAEAKEEVQYDSDTQDLVNAANSARDEFKKVDNQLRDLNNEIQNLKNEIEGDFGSSEEFRVLKENCFEFDDREYTYKLCPFEKAVQISKSGGSETKLGNWGTWAGPPENRYLIMKYTGGQSCWNGPQRSAEIHLSCGTTNQLTAVSEPNRCEYKMHFSTPAVCLERKLEGHVDQQHTEL